MKKIIKQILTIIFVFSISILTYTPQAHASGEGSMAVVEGVIPISISQAKKLMEEGALVFDANVDEVRNEYGYIQNSIHINVENWQKLLPADKNTVMVFYCLNRICYTSSEMALAVMKMGYKNVYVMLEGIEQWIIYGNPVVKASKSPTADKYKYLGSNNWRNSDKVTDYTDVIHRQMMYGDIPSCRDCHGIDVGQDKKMIQEHFASNRDNVNKNCTSCHDDIGTIFMQSAHSKLVNTKENAPMCSDCHSIHLGKETTMINMKKMSDQKCGECHEKEQSMYHHTFHGKAMVLENAGQAISVAACYDCHGTHNIFKIDDNRSTLYAGENRINTCAECHPGGNENFSNFIAHADHTDKENYPLLYYAFVFMTGLVVAVFGFFGLHTFFWSVRLIMTRLKYPEQWKAAKQKAHADKVIIKRFSTLHKWQHFFMAASFLGLAFSGLPQKFYTASWAQSMIDMMGGPIGATVVHHVSAIIMGLVFISHIIEIIVHALKNKDAIRNPQTGKLELSLFWKKLFGPDSLMPRWQDFTDMKNHFLWFFGKGERPQFDRWTYWEKFDYLAVFWGMFIIGLSGLILWFPVFFTKLLPGWMLNLSTIVHSDEALLATGFIFAVHFFNTHFRADRFPMDMVIFSGTLSEEEIKQERKPWYDRLVASGKLEKLKVKNSNFESWSWFAKLVGFAMLITGMVFLFLMIYAFVEAVFF
ncbi:rhodanese-like domain-containing protein [Campylobacter geochelonis]|uniref:Cytochrome c family protein n=1 Tax=Campylobacter geochelonis TaxID=1780362 RepID=A0A128EEQ6_9BACT|nr:rhodanese-like domain-containing protein [Campylobacter geochelonis]QKF70954.1 cytochrome c family protein [Campylobacter geochelonis]CZE47027.1 cytochrome c family protein [Campylobacter geochelonis]CZE47522.1 cytochrome c family protein [Campylobacter geochelonis]CZE50230.1 cytochrome c family protein [Campylobacter geochelonis]